MVLAVTWSRGTTKTPSGNDASRAKPIGMNHPPLDTFFVCFALRLEVANIFAVFTSVGPDMGLLWHPSSIRPVDSIWQVDYF